MSDSTPVPMTKADFEAALDKASEAGAKRVLKELGLDDVNANGDMRELRGLLNSWKDVRKSALQAIVKFLVTALLGALLLGLGIKLGASNVLKG
jgi:hypothetical protein